jgi:cation diffusion facilitator family transporter
MQLSERDRLGLQAVNVGLAANVLLSGLKTTIGIFGHSPALLADGINSTSDVAYYLVVAVFMRLARKPADAEHPYGHTQLESIASLVVGAFVVTTAIAIFWDAVNTVFELFSGRGAFGGASEIALWVAVFTVVLKIGLTGYTRRIALRTGSRAVLALASDHRNDIFSASGAGLGIFLGRVGLPWVDPLAGAFVSLIILRTGVDILRESTHELMDTIPGEALNQEITGYIAPIEGVEEVEEIKVHRFGPYLVIYVTVGIDGTLSVWEGDEIATEIEDTLAAKIDLVRRVHVHYHPCCFEPVRPRRHAVVDRPPRR